MGKQPGTYALILRIPTGRYVCIGRLGWLSLDPGFYVYVGSAFGPGGLLARLARHDVLAKKPHWHIDYLRRYAVLQEAWYTLDVDRREHQWANVFRELAGTSEPLSGFGASDCRCSSHLFYFPKPPSCRRFSQRVHALSPAHAVVTGIHAQHGRLLRHGVPNARRLRH
ncbi:MAG: DUF123 domain-containing protein [Acidiferrobacterales bacterium]